MSINWVMITSTDEKFVKLPSEKVLYVSPPRTTLSIASRNSFSGTQPFLLKSDGGIAYITNQRLVYLPTNPTPELQSFSCPILNIQDSTVAAPFFGANYWTAVARPVAGGNIPPAHPFIELKMVFREGGAYDYHTVLEQIKERLHHALSIAREQGQSTSGTRGVGGVDYSNIDLEQLPAYEPAREISDNENADERGLASSFSSSVNHPAANDSGVSGMRSDTIPKPAEASFEPPNDPPPGYEEAQFQAVGIDLDQRLRDEAERR